MRSIKRLLATAAMAPALFVGFNAAEKPSDFARHAVCILYPDGGSNVKGVVSFSQKAVNKPTQVVCSVKGLRANGLHGFHIH